MTIVGQIGSGKTSLLYSLMDETVHRGGKHKIRGRIAYVEQEPFIIAGSIIDNVCFGLEYAECRFRKAIQNSMLEGDLELFSNGWDTQIGERGQTISGG